jgi:quercetin dioxygenase-like cupin family protein
MVDKKTGTVTLFAFDKGEGLSEHAAPFDAIVYAVEGDADITISGQKAQVTGGDMLIMPANEPHAVRASTRFKMLLVMMR